MLWGKRVSWGERPVAARAGWRGTHTTPLATCFEEKGRGGSGGNGRFIRLGSTQERKKERRT
jgi:hypothetical protein